LAVVVVFIYVSAVAQVKIGSAGSPNSNAVLELDGGTNKGLLLPRLTNTQIAALTTAPDGMIVYNTTDGFLYVRKSAAWQKISDATNAGGGGFILPYNGSSSSAFTAFRINSSTASDAITGYSESGTGIFGFSNTGTGAYFSSIAGRSALVTGAGNVGIGATDPDYRLDVNGRMRIRSRRGDPFNSAGIFYDNIYSAGQGSFVGTFTDSIFGIFGGGNWKFFFDHINNNFGINNSNPQAPLSLSNANGNKLDIYYGSSNSRYGIGLQSGVMQLYCAGAVDNIAFGYGSSTAFTENMRIQGNGNMGIGTSAPVKKLEVRNSGSDGIRVSTASQTVDIENGALGGIIGTTSSNSFHVKAANSIGLTLNTAGNIGIGTLSPSNKLDVNGRMRIRTVGGDLNNSAGIFFDGPTDPQRAFVGIETNDKIGIFGAGSGWAMSLNVNTGNTNMYNSVAVGTTAAPNSKLQVVGGVSMPYTEVTDNYAVTDNDYAIRFVATLNTNFERAIYLPAAAGRAGRIYKISAKIPLAGPANGGTFSPTRVYVVESGTNINVIQDNLSGTGITNFSFANYESYYGVNYNLHGIIKQLNLTVQSNGTSWKIIDDSFSFIQDNREEQ